MSARLEALLSDSFSRGDVWVDVADDVLALANPFTGQQASSPALLSQAQTPQNLNDFAHNVDDSLTETRADTCVMVMGDSGSGKTQTALSIAATLTTIAQAGKRLKALQLPTQLPAAHTLINHVLAAQSPASRNSTRATVCTELDYDTSTLSVDLCGARVRVITPLLQRLVDSGPAEGSFHILYSLFSPGFASRRESLLLARSPGDYKLLSIKNPQLIQQCNQPQYDMAPIIQAMKTLGFTQHDEDVVFALLAAVLHLGNVDFKDGPNDSAPLTLTNKTAMTAACSLLRVPQDDFITALTSTKVTLRGVNVNRTRPLPHVQADLTALILGKYVCMYLETAYSFLAATFFSVIKVLTSMYVVKHSIY